MNAVNLIGRITKDPELKTASNGKQFVAFTIAVSEYFNGSQYTNFIPCFAWDKTAENMARFVKKGNQLGVEGSLNVRQNNANRQIQTVITVRAQRIEFLGSPSNGQTQQPANEPAKASGSFMNYEFDVPQAPVQENDLDADADAILFED